MAAGGRIGTLVGGGATRRPGQDDASYHFASLDLDDARAQPTTIPLTFLAHGVTPHPNEPQLLLLFEKHGPGACALDLSSKAVRTVLTTPANRQFYGHGAFSPDGRTLYCTETDLEDGHRGWISVRDGSTFEPRGDFPTHGLAPHDCMLRDEGRTLVITNGGSAVGVDTDAPCVTHVDVATGELRRREPIPAAALNAGHLAMTGPGGLAVVSAPRLGLEEKTSRGGVSLRTHDGELRPVHADEETLEAMVGETLSVSIHEPSGTVAATNPEGHIVTFWSLHDGSLKHTLRVPNPRGVALSLDGDEFILTFGATAKAARVNATTLEPVVATRKGVPCAITASHVTVLDL